MDSRTEQASIGQRLLWMLDHHRGAAGSLNCPLLCRLRGPLDESLLDRALERLAARHESLRTSFTGRGRRLTQVIHPPRPLAVDRVDLTGFDESEVALRTAVAKEFATPIDVEQWPVRLTLWQVGPDDAVLCVNVHHMVTDAWSCGVIFRELTQLYAYAAGDGPEPAAPGWQYRRWVRWQQAQEHESWPRHREYWKRQLAGTQLPELPFTAPVEAGANGAGMRKTARATVEFDAATAEALAALARERKVTLFAVMLATYYVLLHTETGQDDLAVASLFANRTSAEVEGTVGFLANLVALRTRIDRSARFSDLVRDVHQTVVGAVVHQELPYHLLPANLVATEHRRLDDVIFQMLPALGGTRRFAGLEADVLVPEAVVSRFDVELTVVPRAGGLTVLLQYAEQRVGSELVRRLLDGYASVAVAVASDSDASVRALAAA